LKEADLVPEPGLNRSGQLPSSGHSTVHPSSKVPLADARHVLRRSHRECCLGHRYDTYLAA
jgi:hypothetical protein